MERSGEPMDKNRIEGAAEQSERAMSCEALVIKTKGRKSGGCAVKEVKTAVALASRRKFLGYVFGYGPGVQVRYKVAAPAREIFKQRTREMAHRSGGRSLPEVVERLRSYMSDWKAYFRLAKKPTAFRELDEWLCHRLRSLQLKHLRWGTTMYREWKELGALEADVRG